MKKRLAVILIIALLTLGCTPSEQVDNTSSVQSSQSTATTVQTASETTSQSGDETSSQTVDETTTETTSQSTDGWQLEQLVTTAAIEGLEDLPVILEHDPAELFVFPKINADLVAANNFNAIVDTFIVEAIRRHKDAYEYETYICVQYGYQAYLNDDILSIVLYSNDLSGQFDFNTNIINAINIDLTNDKVLSFEELADRLGYQDNLMAKMEGALIDYMATEDESKGDKDKRLAADFLWLWNMYYETDNSLPFLDEWFLSGEWLNDIDYPDMPDYSSIYNKKGLTGYLDGNGELHVLFFDAVFHFVLGGLEQIVDLNVSAADTTVEAVNPLYENAFGDSEGILGAAKFLTYLSDVNAEQNVDDFLALYDYRRDQFGEADLTIGYDNLIADERYLFVPTLSRTATLIRSVDDDMAYSYDLDYCLDNFMLNCNMSDLHPDTVIEMRYRDRVIVFSPTTSLMSGEMEVPDQLVLFPEM